MTVPIVSTIRVPRTGQPRPIGPLTEKVDAAKAIEDSGLLRLHKARLKGDGVLVAIIDGDFRGWEGLVGKGLPARTHLFDLTAERNDNLKPDAPPAGAGLGHGTEVARGRPGRAGGLDAELGRGAG